LIAKILRLFLHPVKYQDRVQSSKTHLH
jgi:hypothetical protein